MSRPAHCVKRCYDSKSSALAKVRQIELGRLRNKGFRPSTRAYYPVNCAKCGMWHLSPEAGKNGTKNT